MTHTAHRIRALGLGIIAVGVAATSAGVVRGSGSGPSAPEPAIPTAVDCGTFERRLLPEGAVLVFVPCADQPSPRCPGG